MHINHCLSSAKAIPIQEVQKLLCVDATASDAEYLCMWCLVILVDIFWELLFKNLWNNSARLKQFTKQGFNNKQTIENNSLFMSSKSVAIQEYWSRVIVIELAFSRAEHSLPYSDVTIYIFAISYLSSMLYVYRFLWPLRLGWLLVWCLYKEVYLQIFKWCPFDYTAVAGSGKVGPVNQVNHTNRIYDVCCHLIDRPHSVPQLSCNRTLQFSKTLRLNRNAIFQCLVMQFYHLKIL